MADITNENLPDGFSASRCFGRMVRHRIGELGAERVAGLSGAGGSAGGSAPTVVRIARRFDDKMCARELRSSRERHRYMNELCRESEGEIKNRKRLLLGALKNFVASALCFAAAAISSSSRFLRPSSSSFLLGRRSGAPQERRDRE